MASQQPQGANAKPNIVANKGMPQWTVFPDSLPTGQFRGLENREDPTKVRGAFVLGQNMKFRDSGQPTLREGYNVIGTVASNATPVYRSWVFTTRENDIFELKTFNGSLYYFLKGTSTDFALLKSGYTANKEFGFANIGMSNGEFHTFFCNGVDAWNEWNGAYATVASVTANTITKSGATNWNALEVPFYASGTVVINGVVYTYTGGAGSTTLTGVTPDPLAGGVVAGDFTVQGVRAPTWRIYLPFLVASTETFQVGETVTGESSGATAVVQTISADKTFIIVDTVVGTFTAGETITGATSGATVALSGVLDQTLGPPLSSILFAHLARIHCWSAVKRSVWSYSMLDDPYCWTVFAEDTSGGRKDVEFGGPGTAFGRMNQTIIGYKQRGITTLSFVQTGQRVDVPYYTPLVQSDDKGTTLGAIGQKSTFSTPYGMVSVTEDGKMILLKAMSANNQPDYSIISDPIQPIFTRGDHTDATGICVDGVIWYAFRQTSDSGANDCHITGDLRRQSTDDYGFTIPIKWDTVSIGWQPKDWTAIPDGQGGSTVHWHSSVNSNSYAVDDVSKVDEGGGFTANIRTWAEMFGYPHIRKRADRAFVEILMRENSVVTATLLLDEEGYTGQIEKVMRGTDFANNFGSNAFNPFGASEFGSERIGSNGEIEEMTRYRFYFELQNTLFFFNMSLSLFADGENSDFELVRWGVRITEIENQTPKALAI